MTALAGYWSFGAAGTDSARAGYHAGTMLEAQARFGRDSRQRTLGAVTLGRRLWPLLPEDAFDTGPLVGADGRLLLCADARIDNRAELAAALGLSAPLDQTSDAALVLAAWENWGAAACDRLCGAFAVIVWDAEAQELTLARDPFGERPLHYHVGDGFAAVASMPAGLHALPAVPYAADARSMADFLALVPETGSESFFESVARVPPGHVVVIDRNGAVRSKAHWEPPTDLLDLARDEDYAEALRAALDEAVAVRLRRAGGAVGSHLSAGLDSSSVTATAARLCAPDRLFAFTAVPGAPVEDARGIADEGPLAAATAGLHANVEHIRINAGSGSPLAGMDRHFACYQRPVLNPANAVWHDAINDAAAARGVSVLLTGQMGNMSISHGGEQLLSLYARQGALPQLWVLMRQMRRRGHSWPSLLAQAFGSSLPPRWWVRLATLTGRALDFHSYSALSPDAFADFGVGARAAARGLDLGYRPWADSRAMRLWVLRRVDLGIYIKGTLGGWGLDMRDPTADRRLFELTLRIPERQFILGGESRSLARRAFADRLPPAVLAERRRGVQAADWQRGFTAAHAAIGEELAALTRNPDARRLIDLDRLTAAHADWSADASQDEATRALYLNAMLRALAAGHFLRKVARTN